MKRIYVWIRRMLPFDCGGKHYGNHQWEEDYVPSHYIERQWHCAHCPNTLVEYVPGYPHIESPQNGS